MTSVPDCVGYVNQSVEGSRRALPPQMRACRIANSHSAGEALVNRKQTKMLFSRKRTFRVTYRSQTH